MRNLRWSLTGLFACGLPVACADPCLDDGLGQDAPISCPVLTAAGNTEGETDTDATTTTGPDPTTGDTTVSSMSGSQSGTLDGDTETEGETEGETDTDGETLWCLDVDGDGYGDPDNCQPSAEPIRGSVDNADDCDDTSDATFPGAAPNDDPDACMKDADGDDWGDDDPPPGVSPGSDCLDDDEQVAPGVAEQEPTLCTADVDDDGWGDGTPPKGADAGSDCLDDNPDIYPGAAYNEMPPDLCAEDADGDGWGAMDPPPGAEPGNDCDDADANTFPGAAALDSPADACMTDADGDGWGDANPGGGGGGGGGPVSGADCYDGNIDLNPDTLQLTALLPYQGTAMAERTLETIDPLTGVVTPFVTLTTPMGGIPNVNFASASMDDTGAILANDLTGTRLYSVEYAGTCMAGTGTVTPVGMPYGGESDVVCGLQYGSNGNLYGIDNADNLLTFDPATGTVLTSMPILMMGAPVNISSCGMAHDCTEDRLLVANGVDESIYSIDPGTGEATLLRDLDPFFMSPWSPVGLAYDPVDRIALLSAGSALISVDLDSMDPPDFIDALPEPVANLQYLPICQ